MKSDREFIDGIYRKAKARKIERNITFKQRMYVGLPIGAVLTCVMLVIGLGITHNSRLPKSDGVAESRLRSGLEEIYVEGVVKKVLEEEQMYQRIQVKVDSRFMPDQLSETIVIAYQSNDILYQVGDSIATNLTKQVIGTCEYYIMTN